MKPLKFEKVMKDAAGRLRGGSFWRVDIREI
jgi:hypothetical protein